MIIPSEKLKDIIYAISGSFKFRPGIIEKDYYITLILNEINLIFGDLIIFKGGTLLNKVYFEYHRLSVDLDFTYKQHVDLSSRSKRSLAIKPIREKMPALLNKLELTSEFPDGTGFNNSTQYVFELFYPSIITNRREMVKLEVSLRQQPIQKPVTNTLHHFFQDPFTGEDLMPKGSILSLTLVEAVAEKLKAAISRKGIAIRDFYDLWYIHKSGFDFQASGFVTLFKKKLSFENYKGSYHPNFGLDQDQITTLRKQIDTDLLPVIQFEEPFDLDEVFDAFNKTMKTLAYKGG